MNLTLRLIIVVCYFLPFAFFQATCNGLDIKLAYNQQEYVRNAMAADSASASAEVEYEDSTAINRSQHLSVADTAGSISDSNWNAANDALKQMENRWDWRKYDFIVPADGTISAFGLMFVFKNDAGIQLMQTAFVISVLLLFFAPFFKRKKVLKHLVVTNLLLVVVFIIIALIEKVSLLWAAWLLVALLLVQTIITFRKEKVAT